MFIAYKVDCAANGKSYIGITKRGLTRRWLEHLSDATIGKMSALHRAIRDHGQDVFSVQEICCALSWPAACEIEKALIEQHGTKSPEGFNVAPGGGVFSYVKTADAIERSAAKHRGKKRSPEASERAATKIRGRKKPESMRLKLAAYRTGRKHSEETCQKISAARIGTSFNAGEINGQAKLTADQVRNARTRLASGESQRSIARSFGIHYNAIWKIANGIKWKSIV